MSSQNVIRKVYDPDTGRHRLVKGSGEILEEIVSYSRHKDINRDQIFQIFRYFMNMNILHMTSSSDLNTATRPGTKK